MTLVSGRLGRGLTLFAHGEQRLCTPLPKSTEAPALSRYRSTGTIQNSPTQRSFSNLPAPSIERTGQPRAMRGLNSEAHLVLEEIR